MTYRFSNHALAEMQRRSIPADLVEYVLQNPQQVLIQLDGVKIYQSQIDFGEGKDYLLRLFVNESVDPAIIVTVYRTSNISKYWVKP
jgi:hypothetical protein